MSGTTIPEANGMWNLIRLAKLRDAMLENLIVEAWRTGYNAALMGIEDFVAIKSKATPYSVISHELLEFMRINKWQTSQSQNSDAE